MTWYADGLRFRCTACGDCCTGEPGAVWVNDEEIAALAAYLQMEPRAFEDAYVRKKGIGRSLYERFDGDCVLFDKATRRCTVYPARPTQCRTWPFWKDNIESKEAWQETCEVCPGSGKGDLVTLEQIKARLAENARARSRT